jgi:hypothetical protein
LKSHNLTILLTIKSLARFIFVNDNFIQNIASNIIVAQNQTLGVVIHSLIWVKGSQPNFFFAALSKIKSFKK